MRFRLLLPVFLMAFAGAFASMGAGQDKPALPDQPAAQDKPVTQDKPAAPQAPAAEAQVDPQVKEAARGLIEELLRLTHAADIFGDLRRTLREVYIPAVRDFAMGDSPGITAPDPKSAAAAARLLTYMDHLRKGGDELDVALSENREAMISDVAGQMAKTAKAADIDGVRATLKLPAVTKGLDALYAVSKLLTGFSYDDSRDILRLFRPGPAARTSTIKRCFRGLPQGGDAVPAKHKIAKAQALVNDFLSISHVDEMVEDAHRFVRDVYAETAPIPEEDRQALREQADQFEFLYNMQKAMVLAVAPSLMAASLTDDQLTMVHSFVRSPAFAKLSGLLRSAVKTGTAFTKEDILEAKKSFEDLENKAKGQERSAAEENKIKAEWDALADRWTEILKNRISPETRSGLERALEELKDQGAPI